MQVAASLMGATLLPGSCAARLMLFVGGPSTEGPGKVVEKELSEPIRSHKVCLISVCTLVRHLRYTWLEGDAEHTECLSGVVGCASPCLEVTRCTY